MATRGLTVTTYLNLPNHHRDYRRTNWSVHFRTNSQADLPALPVVLLPRPCHPLPSLLRQLLPPLAPPPQRPRILRNQLNQPRRDERQGQKKP